jgi:hypothetical protein
MGKRGVVHPVYGMTEAAFFGRFRSALRKEWKYSQPHKEAIKRAKKPYIGPGKRKFVIACEQCNDKYFLQEKIDVESAKKGKMKSVLAYQVDHKIDAGSLKSFDDLSGFAERLFCHPDELQVLCYHCHHKKTHKKKEIIYGKRKRQ